MTHELWYFDTDKLNAACEAYVENGVKDPKQRALRQEEVDGAKAFLGSEAAKKLRVEQTRSMTGLSPEGKYQARPERLGPVDEADLGEAGR